MQAHHFLTIKDIHKRLEHLESIWDAGAIQDSVRSNTAHKNIQVIDLTEKEKPIEDSVKSNTAHTDIEVIDLTEDEPIVNSHAREFAWGN